MLGKIDKLKRGDWLRIEGVSAHGVHQEHGVVKIKVSVTYLLRNGSRGSVIIHLRGSGPGNAREAAL